MRVHRSALVALVAALALPAAASAQTQISADPDDPRPYQRWVDRSRVPTPDATLRVVAAPCPLVADYAEGCTSDDSYSIWLAPGSTRFAFFHELGHNFDYYAMTADARATFARIAKLSGEWRTADHNTSPHERFAAAYAVCATSYHRRDGKPRFGPRLGQKRGLPLAPQRLGAVCRLIRAVG